MDALRPGDPDRIGDYTTVARLGSGAMGSVYLARSPGGREVAVKLVRPELADDDDFRTRFRHEVAAMRAVGGFWTAAVVDADPDAAVPWLASEYVPGPTLHTAVATRGPLPEPEARALAAGLAEALRAIHAAGLIHRDLKPANVLLAPTGPRVIDFGIARTLDGPGLTATGLVVGTPHYLSPEQIQGDPLTPASDIHALGAVLVYATTGEPPFGSGPVPALLYRIVHGTPTLDHVPGSLRALITHCLNRDPTTRPTTTDLLTTLSRPPDPSPTTPHPDTAAPYPPTPPHNSHPDNEPPTPTPHPRTLPYTSHPHEIPNPPTQARTRLDTTPPPAPAATETFRAGGRLRAALTLAVLGTCTTLLGNATASSLATTDLTNAAVTAALTVGFALPSLYQLWRLLRPRRRLQVSPTGLTVRHGRRTHHLPWSTIARTHITNDHYRPWLLVTPTPGTPPWELGPPIDGAYRAYPIAHSESRLSRSRQRADLRDALALHTPPRDT